MIANTTLEHEFEDVSGQDQAQVCWCSLSRGLHSLPALSELQSTSTPHSFYLRAYFLVNSPTGTHKTSGTRRLAAIVSVFHIEPCDTLTNAVAVAGLAFDRPSRNPCHAAQPMPVLSGCGTYNPPHDATLGTGVPPPHRTRGVPVTCTWGFGC